MGSSQGSLLERKSTKRKTSGDLPIGKAKDKGRIKRKKSDIVT